MVSGASGNKDVTLDDQSPPRHAALVVPLEAAGERLDRYLATTLADLSRVRVQAMIRDGLVRIGGLCVRDPGARLKGADDVLVTLRRATPAEPAGEAIALAVVYEDDDLIVIDKPPGLVVHPAAGHATGTLVNALISHCGDSLSGIGGVKRPGIVHRLDKDTSGLMVAAKTDAAHQGLSAQFASHGADGRLQRAYLAVTWGVPVRQAGVVDLALSRSTANRTKIAVVREGQGRRAVTHYRVLETYRDGEGGRARGGPVGRGRVARSVTPNAAQSETVASLLRLELETGRTHQIRVHMASLGHPLLGDSVYGLGFATRASRLSEAAQAALTALGRQALHACLLGFDHPRTGKPLVFESAPPADLAALLAALRG